MTKHRSLLALLALVGITLTGTGLAQWHSAGSLTLQARIVLASGLAICLAITIEQFRKKRHSSGKSKFPHDDEFSLHLKHRAASIAFHLSIFLWMAIFSIQDIFPESQVMLGIGILGMVALYGISYVTLKSQVLGNEDEN